MKRLTLNMVRVSTGLMMVLSTPCAWALSVTPARTEVRLHAGETAKAVLTVTNPHEEAYDVEITEKPWYVLPENQKIQVKDWLELPRKTEFRLKPGQSRDVTITLHCPKDAVGEVMGMVSFAYQGMTPGMVTPMISTAIYIEIEGTQKNLGEIVALGAGTRNGRFQIGAQIKATGNVRLRPVGKIRVKDDKDQVVSEYTVPELQPLFPGQMRDFTARGSDTPPPAGRYTLAADLLSGTLELKKETKILVKANGEVEMDKEVPKS